MVRKVTARLLKVKVVQGVASYRVPTIPLRKIGTSSEISSKNLGSLGGTGGYIVKVRFYTDEVPFTQTPVS